MKKLSIISFSFILFFVTYSTAQLQGKNFSGKIVAIELYSDVMREVNNHQSLARVQIQNGGNTCHVHIRNDSSGKNLLAFALALRLEGARIVSCYYTDGWGTTLNYIEHFHD